ncbi:Mitochondrial carnitine/acylcarnitine carrier protein [Echinococcus granulosus]|uniref:Mitochondrial carnitine:acylcarnitine carrier n=1 Tax=Echinococcus granulosus TaxID=6210 RepID=A0A068WCN2_ECHGR|nr:Mitochondrial carnitine/acylcarnitine carrier protein [Echinococcus granulosus]CDS15357.1 mitochondrial carnitine:acylcarnitine carrier [Echinococcus granulosus]
MVHKEKSDSSSNTLKSFWAGGFGGICAVAAGYPFDTIKVRLQTMPHVGPGETPIYRGAFDCAVKTIGKEGIGGLYKGMLLPLLGATPLAAVFFSGFSLGKELLVHDAKNIQKNEIFLAGMLSGVFTTALMAPGERVKCLLQVQNLGLHPKYNGPVDVVRRLYLEGGVRSLFKGTAATLLRDVPASGVFFLSYEWIKELTSSSVLKSNLGVAQTLFAGGMAGVFNWLVAIPPDVLKSRLQIAPEGKYPQGIRSVFKELLTKEGVFALYKGAAPVIIRAFPANAACLLGYEVALRVLNYL